MVEHIGKHQRDQENVEGEGEAGIVGRRIKEYFKTDLQESADPELRSLGSV